MGQSVKNKVNLDGGRGSCQGAEIALEKAREGL